MCNACAAPQPCSHRGPASAEHQCLVSFLMCCQKKGATSCVLGLSCHSLAAPLICPVLWCTGMPCCPAPLPNNCDEVPRTLVGWVSGCTAVHECACGAGVTGTGMLCARAGFFLFAVQPFKLGDRVAVSYSTPAAGMRSAWFEGTCEKVDLRCALAEHARA